MGSSGGQRPEAEEAGGDFAASARFCHVLRDPRRLFLQLEGQGNQGTSMVTSAASDINRVWQESRCLVMKYTLPRWRRSSGPMTLSDCSPVTITTRHRPQLALPPHDVLMGIPLRRPISNKVSPDAPSAITPVG